MKKISIIIFDVDGTLYEPISELTNNLHSYWIKRISYHLRISPQEADRRFRELKKKYISSTLTVSSMGLGTLQQVTKQTEHHMRPYHKKYIQKDRKLIKILKKLKNEYTLCTLRNGTQAGTRFILSLIGFSARSDKRKSGYGPFDHLLPTVELGPAKPDPIPYKNALKKLGVCANEILIIGDREAVDLKTAKEFGMRTVLVDWGRRLKYDREVTDLVIGSIYDIKQLLP